MKKFIADPKINFYIIDSVKIGIETGNGTNSYKYYTSICIFQITGIISEKKAIEFKKDTAKKTYIRKGEDVVEKNCDAIDAGVNGVIKVNVPAEWKKIKLNDKKSQSAKGDKETVKFVNLIQKAINSRQGDNLPVSAFMDYTDGATPSGTSAYEKRGIAVKVPVWNADNSIECNFCSMVCPHVVIRPVVLDEK